MTEVIYKKENGGLVADAITVLEQPPREEVESVDEVKFFNQNPDSIGPPREQPRSYVGLEASSDMPLGGTYNLQLPTTQGGVGETLSNDGTGQLEWSSAGSGDVIYTGINPVPTSNQFAIYDVVEGKKIKDSGISAPAPASGVLGDVLTLTGPTTSVWSAPAAAGVSGLAPTTVGNLSKWDDITAGQISDTSLVAVDVVQNSVGVGVAGNLVEFGASPEQIVDSGTTTADFGDVSSASVPSVADRLALYSGVSGKEIKQSSAYTLDESVPNKIQFRSGGNTVMTPTSQFSNTFYGLDSGDATSGSLSNQSNTAIGSTSLTSNVGGSRNTSLGAGSLTTALGSNNTAVGAGSGTSLIGVAPVVSGSDNVLVGNSAGTNIVSGSSNTLVGAGCGTSLTLADSNNIIIGTANGSAGDNDKIIIGDAQTACEIKGIHGVTPPLASETVIIDTNGELGSTPTTSGTVTNPSGTGPANNIVVFGATPEEIADSTIELDPTASNMRWKNSIGTSLFSPINFPNNVFFGSGAGAGMDGVSFANAFQNCAFGVNALSAPVASQMQNNSAFGRSALADCTGRSNTAIGSLAMSNATTAVGNTALGGQSLFDLLTGFSNISIGVQSGSAYVGAESYNVLLGNTGVLGDSNTMRLGRTGFQPTNETFVEGVVGVQAGPTYNKVLINPADGQLGEDTPAYGEQYRQGNTANDTALTVGVWAGLNGIGRVNGGVNDFLQNVGYSMTYTGTPNIMAKVNVSVTWENDSFSNIKVQLGVFKNANALPEPNLRLRAHLDDGNDYPRNATLSGFVDLSNGDTLSVQCLNETDGDDILFWSTNFNISKMGLA